MSKARLSGPPAIEPVAMPIEEHGRQMARLSGPLPEEPLYMSTDDLWQQEAQRSTVPAAEPITLSAERYQYQPATTLVDEVHNTDQEPVSPLSPDSEAMVARRQDSSGIVSPVSSPVDSSFTTKVRRQTPRAHAPPRRPYGNGVVISRKPVHVNQERHRSVKAVHAHASRRRPRPQSIQAVPDTFLQDFADHAGSIIRSSQKRPRSRTLPSSSSEQGRQRSTERSKCAHCGKIQRNQRAEFISCTTCRGVFYCSTPCWDNRVCHRSVKCRTCSCVQASTLAMDFKRCTICALKNREIWYCSSECYDTRDCHAREDQMPPNVPTKAQSSAPQQARHGQGPASSQHRTNRHDGTFVNRNHQNGRDLEAQKPGKLLTPKSNYSQYGPVKWAAGISAVVFVIFVPILVVVVKNTG